MSDGNPHLACGLAPDDHRVAACADCGMPFIEHSLQDLTQSIVDHTTGTQTKNGKEMPRCSAQRK